MPGRSGRLCGLLIVTAWLALSGCSRQETVTERFLAFGTLIEISIYGADTELTQEALRVARKDLDYMHEAWHAWRPNALGRINMLIPTGASFTGSPTMVQMILASQRLAEQSEGLFNPAIGRLIALWGFQSDEPPSGPPPDATRIEALLAERPRMSDLTVDGVRIRADNAAVRLDFGAFAKGYGIDLVSERLKELGVHNAIINAGGDLRAFGRPGSRAWRIGIRHPRDTGVLASLEIRNDESVFTSGDYERYFDHAGRRYHHILDPRTGYPADGAISATVIHSDAATADAASTALFVAGPRDWRRIAARMGIEQVMIVDREGRVHLSRAMAERIRFETEPKPETLVDPGL
ncbi:MAG: FAD:protein FMN transferase [Thiohalocapsa sp.]